MKSVINKKKNYMSFGLIYFYLINCIIGWVLYTIRNVKNYNIVLVSWWINIIFLVSFYSFFRIIGKIGLQHIILMVCFLFNFGQTFMWSLGIHSDNEIGKTKLYSNYKIPNNVEIYRGIIYSGWCFLALLIGMTLILGIKKQNNLKQRKDIMLVVYKVSICLAWVVVPLTFVKIFITISFSLINGYASLYYGGFVLPPILDFAEKLFFPVIIGILLGSEYKTVKIIYTIFGAFVLLYCVAGERGNWFYDLLVLLWLHHNYYKKMDIKKMLKLFLISFLALYLIGAVVDLRQYGLGNVSVDTFISAMSLGNNPIIRFIMEMGGSLGVTIVVLGINISAFPVKNSFLAALLGSVSTKLANILGVPVVYLSNYLSQNILKITYGAGFNLFAETYVNGSVLYMVLFGAFFALLLGDNCGKEYSFKAYISIIITPIICSGFRNESLSLLKNLVQVGILYPLAIMLIYKIIAMRKRVWIPK